jgi:hypothetical protein
MAGGHARRYLRESDCETAPAYRSDSRLTVALLIGMRSPGNFSENSQRHAFQRFFSAIFDAMRCANCERLPCYFNDLRK